MPSRLRSYRSVALLRLQQGGGRELFECENVLQGSGPHSEDEARSFVGSKRQQWIKKLSLRRELQCADLLPASL